MTFLDRSGMSFSVLKWYEGIVTYVYEYEMETDEMEWKERSYKSIEYKHRRPTVL